MTIFIVDTFVVRPEKQGEFMPFMQKALKYMKENPEKFKEMKSYKIFSPFSGISRYTEMLEFDSMTAFEKYLARNLKDEGYMKLLQEFMLCIEPATYSRDLWNTVM